VWLTEIKQQKGHGEIIYLQRPGKNDSDAVFPEAKI
jgi:hypothetical protein